jgi:hypothetical protein
VIAAVVLLHGHKFTRSWLSRMYLLGVARPPWVLGGLMREQQRTCPGCYDAEHRSASGIFYVWHEEHCEALAKRLCEFELPTAYNDQLNARQRRDTCDECKQLRSSVHIKPDGSGGIWFCKCPGGSRLLTAEEAASALSADAAGAYSGWAFNEEEPPPMYLDVD